MTTYSRLAAALGLALVSASCEPADPPPLDSPFAGVLHGAAIAVGDRPFGLAVSSDYRVLVTRQDADSVALFNTGATAVEGHAVTGSNPGDAVFTADGAQIIVSAFNGGTLHLINATTGAQIDQVTIGSNAYRLALSANGTRVFVTTTNSVVYAIDRITFEKVDSVTLTGSLQGISRHPTSGQLAVSATDGGVWLLDPNTLDVVTSVDVGSDAQEILFGPGGTTLYVALENQPKVLILNPTTLARTDSLSFAANIFPFGMAVSPNEKTLLVGSAITSTLVAYNLETRSVLRTHTLTGQPRRMAFTPDGFEAFVATEGNQVLRLR
jgi:DNA-binding beta-propeller fold protein YncE